MCLSLGRDSGAVVGDMPFSSSRWTAREKRFQKAGSRGTEVMVEGIVEPVNQGSEGGARTMLRERKKGVRREGPKAPARYLEQAKPRGMKREK